MDGNVGGAVVYHDVQHTDANDAIEAIETFVGTSASPNFSPTPQGTPTIGNAVVVNQASPLLLGYNSLLSFTQAGQIPVGTGDGTGEILASGTAGQALIVGGSDPSGLEWGNPTAIVAIPNDGPTGCLSQTMPASWPHGAPQAAPHW